MSKTVKGISQNSTVNTVCPPTSKRTIQYNIEHKHMVFDYLFNQEKTNAQTQVGDELQSFMDQRKWEREVFDSLLKQWLMHSGLGEIMMEQMEDYLHQCGLEEWPEQFDHYNVRFDPDSIPEHREIKEYVNSKSSEKFCQTDFPKISI